MFIKGQFLPPLAQGVSLPILDEYEYIPGIDATRGYWIYMENPDQLAGFSTTPLPMPEWFWDL
jgi:hypothetical protein